MKFFAGFLAAFAITIAWQTSVLSGEGTSDPVIVDTAVTAVRLSDAAGRVPTETGAYD